MPAALPFSNDDKLLLNLQHSCFKYFQEEINPDNGLVRDKTAAAGPGSIAAVGLALAAYPVAVERGWMRRRDALKLALRAAGFFRDSDQSGGPGSTGYRGFYFHFLDMKAGRRAWQCELSSIDTALLLAGMLAAAAYFDGDGGPERELRAIAAELYERVDWPWMQNDGQALVQAWRPNKSFGQSRWQGYNEALLLYVLALGSPRHPINADAYRDWASTYRWKTIYGHKVLYAGPLFIHQLSHGWLDLAAISDDYMREEQLDYFENSRRATYIQKEYAVRHARRGTGYCYHGDCWGFSACDGPDGRSGKRRFFDYMARGAPFGPDDGTVSPCATAASLPFAPEIVLPALRHFEGLQPASGRPYGYRSFNRIFNSGWLSPYDYALDNGPVVMMIENWRSGLLWQLMKQVPEVAAGLRKAGFKGGWVEPGPVA